MDPSGCISPCCRSCVSQSQLRLVSMLLVLRGFLSVHPRSVSSQRHLRGLAARVLCCVDGPHGCCDSLHAGTFCHARAPSMQGPTHPMYWITQHLAGAAKYWEHVCRVTHQSIEHGASVALLDVEICANKQTLPQALDPPRPDAWKGTY